VAIAVVDAKRLVAERRPDARVLPTRQLGQVMRSFDQRFRLTFGFVQLADLVEHDPRRRQHAPAMQRF
jgi:hypothetical protein